MKHADESVEVSGATCGKECLDDGALTSRVPFDRRCGWREAPFFSDPERAALGLAEAITRVADQIERVPDAVWNEAKLHYDEPALAWLVFEVAVANLYNRLNVATRQVAGTQRW